MVPLQYSNRFDVNAASRGKLCLTEGSKSPPIPTHLEVSGCQGIFPARPDLEGKLILPRSQLGQEDIRRCLAYQPVVECDNCSCAKERHSSVFERQVMQRFQI